MAETLANGTTIPQGTDLIHSSGVQAMRNLGGSVDGQLGNRYTKAQADALLAGKAASSHTHPVSQVTGLQAALDQAALTAEWAQLADKPTVFPPSAHTHAQSDIDGLQAALAQLTYRSGRINITSNLDPAPVSGDLWIERRGGTVWLHMDALVLTATDMPERVYSNVIPTGYRIVAPAELPLAPRLADETRDVQTNIRTYNHVLAFYRVSGGAAVRGMVSWPTDQALPTT